MLSGHNGEVTSAAAADDTITEAGPASLDEDGFTRAVGQRLRAIRQAQGLSLAEVEVRSEGKWSASAVGAYERGFRTLSLPRIDPAAPIRRFVHSIIDARGDFNGKVLSLRHDDLKALCTLVGGDIPTGVAQLRSWGVMVDGPEVPADPLHQV